MEILKRPLQWSVLGALVGACCGGASALFLVFLELVTDYRGAHEILVWFLPLAGLAIGTLYAKLGRPVKTGTNLVIDTIHDEGPEIPLRMFPLVLAGTVLTHLFGGSAGREGTAVQMGASLTDFLSHRLKLDRELRRDLIVAGVAGGFGSVFGTPIAGTIFGMEFVVRGRIEYRALVPALVASITGDLVTRRFVAHTTYPTPPHLSLTPLVCVQWIAFAIAVAVTALVFIELTHFLKKRGEQHVKQLGVRMAIGGAIVVGLWQLLGTSDYLGLGVPMIVRSFSDAPSYAFALKLVFTAITLGAGFLGGEVTPLFFIGAALGGTVGPLLGLPRALAAGVGLAAVFAAASNTPLALSIMAVELLGANVLPHVVIVCVVAYALSGKRTIYTSQR
jgi:H+/Cl- antiporter ClcA